MLFHILHCFQDILSDEGDGQDFNHDEKNILNDEALHESNIQIQQLDGFDTSMEDSFDDEPMNIDTFPNDENVSNFFVMFFTLLDIY